jgi:hypothetical protein
VGQTLSTWSLIPSSQSSPLWELSTYRGEAIVRAKDEIQARQIAGSYFRRRGGPTDVISRIQSPWYIQSLVRCHVIEDSDQFEMDVPGIILPGVRARMNQALHSQRP